MENKNQHNHEHQPLLFVATIYLSLVGGGIGIILFSLAALFFSKTKELVTGVTNLTSMDHITPLYFLLFAGLCLISFIGVLKMKRWQKRGFYLYLAAQLVMLFLPVLWIDWNAFSVTNCLFTSLFILIYLTFYKNMV